MLGGLTQQYDSPRLAPTSPPRSSKHPPNPSLIFSHFHPPIQSDHNHYHTCILVILDIVLRSFQQIVHVTRPSLLAPNYADGQCLHFLHITRPSPAQIPHSYPAPSDLVPSATTKLESLSASHTRETCSDLDDLTNFHEITIPTLPIATYCRMPPSSDA